MQKKKKQKQKNKTLSNNLISRGWKKTPLATFAEGYGQRAYLIPKDATRALNTLTQNDFLAMSMQQVTMPPCPPIGN